MNKFKDLLQTILTIAIIGGITTVLYLYTSGYRLQKGENKVIDLTTTGMVNAKSIPESANVYLDGKLLTATNDTIAGLEPGTHSLRIAKKGYVEWKKDIEVFPELVTDITAILVSQTPRLEPLTNTGARKPVISPSLTKLAYFSQDSLEPGIYIVPLSGINVNIFGSNTNLAIKDTKVTKYSEGTSIEWSPEETQILVEGTNKIFYVVDLSKGTAQTTASPDLLRNTWKATVATKRTEMLNGLEISADIKNMALSDQAMWSPDEKKFLYTVKIGNIINYMVYNLEKPLPIGEKMENTVLKINATDKQPFLSWYPDSFHLVMVESDIEKTQRGVISLIRIDGTNKTEVYSNTILSNEVFSTKDGDKLVILTSFKSGNQTDLYTIGIR